MNVKINEKMYHDWMHKWIDEWMNISTWKDEEMNQPIYK